MSSLLLLSHAVAFPRGLCAPDLLVGSTFLPGTDEHQHCVPEHATFCSKIKPDAPSLTRGSARPAEDLRFFSKLQSVLNGNGNPLPHGSARGLRTVPSCPLPPPSPPTWPGLAQPVQHSLGLPIPGKGRPRVPREQFPFLLFISSLLQDKPSRDGNRIHLVIITCLYSAMIAVVFFISYSAFSSCFLKTSFS